MLVGGERGRDTGVSRRNMVPVCRSRLGSSHTRPGGCGEDTAGDHRRRSLLAGECRRNELGRDSEHCDYGGRGFSNWAFRKPLAHGTSSLVEVGHE